MLNINNDYVKQHLLDGNFGLEKESLRVTEDGSFAHTKHPFPDDENIVKDFCENQVEINTGVHDNIEDTVRELYYHNTRVLKRLYERPGKEYLWCFSNPPAIKNEDDIPIAIFEGSMVSKAAYRKYLSDKYGRYKMAFSGIHFNFSFSEELLKEDYRSQDHTCSFREYKDTLYLTLAERMAAYSWLIVCITAASPVMDSSCVEKGVYGKDFFAGMSSVRCSEMGYWNEFAPIFDYSDIENYAGSIQRYVDRGFLKAPSELYYPIRLKPKGENNLDTLRQSGVNHIELRMFDLNPLLPEGIDERDLKFAHLMMVWLSATPRQAFADMDQVQAVANFKNAARYDLKTVKILTPGAENFTVADAALKVLGFMQEFFDSVDLGRDVKEILAFERSKFTDPNNRYSWQIRSKYSNSFAEKALQLSKERSRSL